MPLFFTNLLNTPNGNKAMGYVFKYLDVCLSLLTMEGMCYLEYLEI